MDRAVAEGIGRGEIERQNALEDGHSTNGIIKCGVNDHKGHVINVDGVDSYDEVGEIPDVYGTSLETTFTFEVNGQVLQPGESIYIQSSTNELPKVWVGK
jgi:hypothetical protein